MKKIAILIRGPIRPDIKSCLNNIENLVGQIKGYEMETFFLTWKDKNVSKFIENDKKNLINNYIVLEEPSKEYIETQLKTRCKVPGPLFDRNYKMFWSQKLGLDFILSNGKKYDYIITTRPDLEIDLIDINLWLKEDIYMMPKLISSNDDELNINDQFGVGSDFIMYNAWNYKNTANLNKLYGESIGPESCFYNIIRENGIKLGHINTLFKLNPKRNFNDKTYIYRNRQKIYFYIINPITKIFGKDIENKIFNIIQKIFPYRKK